MQRLVDGRSATGMNILTDGGRAPLGVGRAATREMAVAGAGAQAETAARYAGSVLTVTPLLSRLAGHGRSGWHYVATRVT